MLLLCGLCFGFFFIEEAYVYYVGCLVHYNLFGLNLVSNMQFWATDRTNQHYGKINLSKKYVHIFFYICILVSKMF